MYCNNNIQFFNSLEKLYSSVFLFGMHYYKLNLVISEDAFFRKGFINFLFDRNAKAIGEYTNEAAFGFCVIPDLPKDLNFANISSITLIGKNNVANKRSELPENVPTYFAAYNAGYSEPSDFWCEPIRPNFNIEYPPKDCFLMNTELKNVFLNTFILAEKEIDIICPWLNRNVINNQMIKLFEYAIKRGVLIKITYGIGSGESDERNAETESTVEMLKDLFEGSNLLLFNKGNTHIKYLICDDKYMMCGSYNFFSFSAEYEGFDNRDEGMEYIVDKSKIIQRRKQLFSWNEVTE